MATRKVLGASTRRIALQHVLESALLTTLGVAGGLGIAWLIMRSFEGERLFRLALERFTLGWSMLGTVGALAVGTTVLFGALPAIFAGRFDLGAALRSADVRETGRMSWLRGTLSAGQIALTLSLVAGGLLMFQTVANLRSVETGLDEEGVARLRLDTPSELDPTELNALYRRMLTDIEALPGVERAALDVFGPHGSSASGTIRVPGTPRADGRRALLWQVTPGWFDVFRVLPVHGRVFQDSDWQPFAPSGVVITESVARGLFGRTDVVGQTVLTRFTEEVARPVLGVVADYTSLRNPGEPTDAFFVSFGEVRVSSSLSVLARTDRFGLEVAAGIRGVAEALLPDVPVPDPVLVSTTVEGLHSQEAMIGRMLWILAAFGLLMSGVGLYGVIYFLVSHRRHELGIRLALGADAARLLRLVAGSAVRIVLVGMTVGLVVAYGLSRVLQSRFFGVTATDPASYAAAALVLATIGVLACVAPARTALSIDPVATLRQE